MLALRVLGGGGQAIGSVVGSGCNMCFRKIIQEIPHPSEYSCIGKIYWILGCHTHKKFNLIAEIHNCTGVPKGSQIYVGLFASRFSMYSQAVKEYGESVEIYQRLTVHVRQCEEFVELKIFKKGFINNDLLGTINLNVTADLENRKFPKNKWYEVARKGKAVLKINVSFFKIDSDLAVGQSILMQQAIILAEQEAIERNQDFYIDIGSLSDKEKLIFFSKVLEGPLKKKNVQSDAWSELYFKAVEVRPNRWEWCYWSSKKACISGEKKKGCIPLLSISLVIPYNDDRNLFFMRYHDMKDSYDLTFCRIDRDRNIWSDGIYQFIEKLREYLEKYPAFLPHKGLIDEEKITKKKKFKPIIKPYDESDDEDDTKTNNSENEIQERLINTRRLRNPLTSFDGAEANFPSQQISAFKYVSKMIENSGYIQTDSNLKMNKNKTLSSSSSSA